MEHGRQELVDVGWRFSSAARTAIWKRVSMFLQVLIEHSIKNIPNFLLRARPSAWVTWRLASHKKIIRILIRNITITTYVSRFANISFIHSWIYKTRRFNFMWINKYFHFIPTRMIVASGQWILTSGIHFVLTLLKEVRLLTE